MRKRNSTAAKRNQERALKRRIGNAELLALGYFFTMTTLLALVLGRVLLAANAVYSHSKVGAEVVLRPNPFSFYVCGGLIAFFVAFWTSEGVHRRLLGRPPEKFNADYFIAASPYPTWMKRAAVLCIATASLVAVLNVRKHATVGSALIIDQPALSIVPDRYQLNLVKEIRMARFYITATKYSPPRISDEPTLFVKFQDGRSWSPRQAELQVADQTPLAEVISSRTGKPVSYTEDIEGVPDEAVVQRRKQTLINALAGSILFLVALWAIRTYFRTARRSRQEIERKPRRTLAR